MSASTMASAAASANSSALVRSCLPNLVIPTPITATRRIDPPEVCGGRLQAHDNAHGRLSKEGPALEPEGMVRLGAWHPSRERFVRNRHDRRGSARRATRRRGEYLSVS